MPESDTARGDDVAVPTGDHAGHVVHPGHAARQAAEPAPRRSPGGTAGVLAAVAAGGAAGAMARYVLTLAFPDSPGGFPWALFGVNVGGCALIGVLMVLLGEGRWTHPLVRPFLSVGVLGGFTTFSSFALDVHLLVAAGRPGVALGYLAGTLLAGLAAVGLAVRGTRRVLRRGRAA